VLTEPRSPRAATVEELLRAVPAEDPPRSVALAPSAADALTIALAQTPTGGTVCVTGSLYLVGEIKALLAAGV
jgi:dihydrofolate synthase/folylpolyglutamate synthase